MTTGSAVERARALQAALDENAESARRFFPVVTSTPARTLRVRHGRSGDGVECLNFAASNYLGLNGREEVREAGRRALERYGSGANGAPILNGRFEVHEALEDALMRFHGAEAAMLFPSGYAANLSLVGTLCGSEDLVAVDRLAHASVYDGLRLSPARRCLFAHNDVEDLRARLRSRRRSGTSALVVTEGVFSMDADVGRIPEIVALCRQEDALLLLDDAHALGVLGKTGRGSEEHFGLPAGVVDLHMGTLSKTLGGAGGYVVGRKDLVDLVRFTARPALFSAHLPPVVAAACLAALEILEVEGARLAARLRGLARFFRAELRRHGVAPEGDLDVPIVPVVLGDDADTLAAADALMAEGVFAHAVVFPAVARGAARLRFMLNVGLTENDLRHAARTLGAALAARSAGRNGRQAAS